MTPRIIHDNDGNPLDATFLVEGTSKTLSIVINARGGTRGTPDARNTDYGRGLTLLLERLRQLGARIRDAVVDSKATERLRPAERRLLVDGHSYPITIEDPDDLQLRLGAAQARIGREQGAKGSGNRTKRLRISLGFSGPPPTAEQLSVFLTGLRTAPHASGPRQPLGLPYSNVGKLPPSTRRDPFKVDPDKVDRGTQGHASTQDSLADFLRLQGILPLRPRTDEPEFDLAWEHDESVFVAEVKSITDANEEKQLRLGLGQVLHYRQLLSRGGRKVIGVLVPEREPADGIWTDLCRELGVLLAWPGAFDRLR